MGMVEGISLCGEMEFAYIKAGEEKGIRTKILKSLTIYKR